MDHEVERARPTDPRLQAYQAGMELARRMGVGQLVDGSAFEHPFFQQGQTKKERRIKRQIHVISDTEHILTEETTETEVFTFGNDLFGKNERR